MYPKVSIIIPTFKRSEFLIRAIDSVLNQTYNNIEIIVVDDNEPDSNYRKETEEKLKNYIKKNQIVYIKNESNLGGALARNVGIKKATGEYITFLDDDDEYEKNKVEYQLKFMLENNFDLSFTDIKIYNSFGKLIDYRKHVYVNNLSNTELLKQHIIHHLTPTNTYMFKSEKLKLLGGFDDVSMGQEFRLMLKAIESELNIGYLPRADVIQYVHDGERISVGTNKIIKEKELYEFKKNYFYLLNRNQIRYVKFRHNAVLAVVGMRSKKYIFSIKHLFFALLISPHYFLKEALEKIQLFLKKEY